MGRRIVNFVMLLGSALVCAAGCVSQTAPDDSEIEVIEEDVGAEEETGEAESAVCQSSLGVDTSIKLNSGPFNDSFVTTSPSDSYFSGAPCYGSYGVGLENTLGQSAYQNHTIDVEWGEAMPTTQSACEVSWTEMIVQGWNGSQWVTMASDFDYLHWNSDPCVWAGPLCMPLPLGCHGRSQVVLNLSPYSKVRVLARAAGLFWGKKVKMSVREPVLIK